MKNKNLLIGGAVVGALLFLWWRNQNKEDQNVLKDDSLGGGGGGALARENGGGAVMQTGVPVVVAPVTSTLRPLRIEPNSRQNAINRANQLRPAPIGLGSRPINVGGTTIGGSGSSTPNTTLGGMSGINVQSAIDRVRANRSNFLTFDGGYAQNTGLDFEGNLD